MPQTINTNIISLTAQRNLNTSQASLAVAMQRLSSGLRLNSAKDDAAGLAISERFTTQIRGLNQAIRNANDGISLAQVGEGALGEVTSNLQRIRELAVQSANATNSDSDRVALDQEVQQRLAEIDRIAAQTTFNGRKLLDGSFGNAVFQVGPDAGQTIGLDLPASTRIGAIGQIAKTTSAGLGAGATGGSLTVNATNTNFGTAAAAATVGTATINASTRLFGTAAAAQVDGSSASITPSNLDFSNTYVAQVDATMASTNPLTVSNFSGAALGQFDVSFDGGATVAAHVTLTADYGSLAGVATEIQSQIRSQTGNTGFTVTESAGTLTYTNTGSTNAVKIMNADANAVTAGIANQTGAAGTAASGTDKRASFLVDGSIVNLSADYTGGGVSALATAITGQLTGYTANVSGGSFTLSKTGFTTAVNTTVNGAAPALQQTNAASAGLDPTTGTAGTAAVATTNATFTIDGLAPITLNTNYASFDAMAADLEVKMDTAAGSDAYSIVNNNGTFTISRTGAPGVGSTAIDITAVGAGQAGVNATTAGFGIAVNGTAGTNAVATTNASFKVDGTTVNLTTNFADPDGAGPLTAYDALATAIEGQLTGYTVTNNAGAITITNNTLGSAAVSITDPDVDGNAAAAGFDTATGTAGVALGSITLASGDFTIKVGDGTAFDFAGTYASPYALATAINRELAGISAEATKDGKLKLISGQNITLGGTQAVGAGTTMGFTSPLIVANDGVNGSGSDGSLANANVLTVTDSNETMVRVDTALTAVSALRSTFGAIQNRFESVITNLAASAENLTASRSRIIDADFAAETAALSRAQILQQAGTAMVAQANQVPQGVLALLRQ